MGILNNIEVSLPDTIAIATTPNEVIFHSCSTPTSIEDVWLTVVIGIIVMSCLWIIGHYTWKSIVSTQNAQFNRLKSRQEHELAKLSKEAEIKTAANLFNANQIKEQRDWNSVADQIKNEGERIKNEAQRMKNERGIKSLDKIDVSEVSIKTESKS